ncbi:MULTISPECIES: hypothetical protein [Pseudomonas]|uniref:Uncharacterized protein n=1 Tax=Pseudomonas synxantha TaxID=47883 RepID=A0ACC6JTI9_9PSED|nr:MULTISPECIES: hypothetical protein [Pseudomonas]MDR6609601.1 hypothetical protein [Pseudomonas synxantha]
MTAANADELKKKAGINASVPMDLKVKFGFAAVRIAMYLYPFIIAPSLNNVTWRTTKAADDTDSSYGKM